MKNNYCDGGTNPECSNNPEVRILPTGGESNAILCKCHYEVEMRFRRERNRELGKDCQFALPQWNSLKIYLV